MVTSEFVGKKAYAEAIGLKAQRLTNWQNRYWVRGFHYTIVGRTTLIHRERVEAWIYDTFSPTLEIAKDEAAKRKQSKDKERIQRRQKRKSP